MLGGRLWIAVAAVGLLALVLTLAAGMLLEPGTPPTASEPSPEPTSPASAPAAP